jgi:hypothetical protein
MQVHESVDPQVREEMARFRADATWVEAHHVELLERYADQWIAVYDQQVVGAARDLKRLVKQLEGKGIRPGRTYTEYLTEKDEVLILPAIL